MNWLSAAGCRGCKRLSIIYHCQAIRLSQLAEVGQFIIIIAEGLWQYIAIKGLFAQSRRFVTGFPCGMSATFRLREGGIWVYPWPDSPIGEFPSMGCQHFFVCGKEVNGCILGLIDQSVAD